MEHKPETVQDVRPPSPMEFGSMPLDPFYAWGISYEPLEILIERTSDYIETLAKEAYAEDKEFTENELIERFQAFFQQLVDEGLVRAIPTPPETRDRWRIVRPRQWARAQNARIKRIVAWWQAQNQGITEFAYLNL